MSERRRSARFARTERERRALPLAPSVGQSRSPPLADIIGARRVITNGWDEMPSFAIGLIVGKAVIQPLAKAGFIKVWPGQSNHGSRHRPPSPARASEGFEMVGLNVLDRAPARRRTTGREPVVVG
jgi:hypothetical protein